MKLMSLEALQGHDVYEFCCSDDYPNNWNSKSLYMSDEDFIKLSPFLNKVFMNYHYYGPQKITYQQWRRVIDAYHSEHQQNSLLDSFFIQIDEWLEKYNKTEYFWILGI